MPSATGKFFQSDGRALPGLRAETESPGVPPCAKEGSVASISVAHRAMRRAGVDIMIVATERKGARSWRDAKLVPVVFSDSLAASIVPETRLETLAV
ncbi:hypothetical protein D3C72_1933950 [compost metagenome]